MNKIVRNRGVWLEGIGAGQLVEELILTGSDDYAYTGSSPVKLYAHGKFTASRTIGMFEQDASQICQRYLIASSFVIRQMRRALDLGPRVSFFHQRQATRPGMSRAL